MTPHVKTINTKTVHAMTSDGVVYTAEKKTRVIIPGDYDYVFEETRLIGILNGVTNISDFKVLNWIKLNLDFNNEVITLNKFYKEKIKEYTKLSGSAIEHSIGRLTTLNIIIRDKTCPRCAMYHVNPAYVWKGDTATRTVKMKHVIELIQLDDTELQRQEDIKRYENEVIRPNLLQPKEQ